MCLENILSWRPENAAILKTRKRCDFCLRPKKSQRLFCDLFCDFLAICFYDFCRKPAILNLKTWPQAFLILFLNLSLQSPKTCKPRVNPIRWPCEDCRTWLSPQNPRREPLQRPLRTPPISTLVFLDLFFAFWFSFFVCVFFFQGLRRFHWKRAFFHGKGASPGERKGGVDFLIENPRRGGREGVYGEFGGGGGGKHMFRSEAPLPWKNGPFSMKTPWF